MGSDELSGKPEEILGGYLVMDWHPIQGEVVILLITLCLGNWDKLLMLLIGPLSSSTDLTLPFQLTMKPMILPQ